MKELGLITDEQKECGKTDVLRKIIAIIVLGFIFAIIVYKFNGADTFAKGFGYSLTAYGSAIPKGLLVLIF